MKKTTLRILFLLAVAYSGIWLLSRCGLSSTQQTANEGKRWFRNLPDSVEYVGAETCKECHAAIHTSFAQTGMGQSFKPAKPAFSQGQFHQNHPLYDSSSGLGYKPYWKGDSLVVEEFSLQGNDTQWLARKVVDYIVGSGHHTNSHILSRNGYLFQAPFTFYTQKGKLDLPPGFEGGANSRFTRQLGMECLSCHNGYPEHVAGSINKYTRVPLGIDCERCHGPGALHVKEKREGKMVDVGHDTDFTIVNPRKLPYEYQVDVCQRCHLQGNAVLKEGKDWDDFKPGMRLKEVMEVFMPALANEEGSFVMASHPDRLQLSKCFTAANASSEVENLSCITCHNPHQSVRKTKKAYFNQKCIDCHQQPEVRLCAAHPNSTECISCHMQPSSTVDIPHVSVTDHYIRIYDNDSVTKAQSNTIIGLRCMTSPNPGTALKLRAYLQYLEKFDYAEGVRDSARLYWHKLEKQNHEDLGIQWYFLQGEYQKVVELYRRNHQGNFDHRAAYMIGQSFEYLGNQQQAIMHYQRALDQMPLWHEYAIKLAQVELQTGAVQQAKKRLDKVLQEQPWNADALNVLGMYYLLDFSLNKAGNAFDKALKESPFHQQAMLNKSKVYMGRNDLKAARQQIEKVLDYYPNDRDAALLLKRIETLSSQP